MYTPGGDASADVGRTHGGASSAGRSQSVPGAGDIAFQLHVRFRGKELSFLSTIAAFGTPYDITVAELAIEAFVPAGAQTAAVLHTGV